MYYLGYFIVAMRVIAGELGLVGNVE